MRKALIRWLLAIVAWLDTDQSVVTLIVHPKHLHLALAATAASDRRFGSGFGSAKRRDALASLLDQGLSESEAALAIELVLR